MAATEMKLVREREEARVEPRLRAREAEKGAYQRDRTRSRLTN